MNSSNNTPELPEHSRELSREQNRDNYTSQMRKGMLEYCVLLLMRNQPAYASQLIAGLKEAHLIVVEGTLYPLLTRLKNAGLLTYIWEESTQGPPRKYYSLTEEGHRRLAALDEAWCEIEHTIQILRAEPSATQEEPRTRD